MIVQGVISFVVYVYTFILGLLFFFIKLLGAKPYGTGHVEDAQLTTVREQINLVHTPPTVRKICRCYFLINVF